MPAVLPIKPLSYQFKNLSTLGFVELANGIDVSEIKAELDANPDLWNKYGFRKTAPNTPHSQMSDIWVRANKQENIGPKFCDEHYPIWYETSKKLPATKKFIMDLMAWVGGENLGGVLITKVPPNYKIERHADTKWHAKFFDKFYLQIQGSPEQAFVSEDHDYRPNTGDVYWFNNTREHWVENNSNIDRITLIICIKIDHD